MNTIKFRDIRNLSPLNNYRFNTFVGHFISSSISPLFTIFFIKKSVKPNTITLFMILSGIIGAILFSLPYLYTKILGFIFFHLWFIFDCSDGEVARITKQFSRYGKEMDFMAHLICHPLMNLSLWVNFVQMKSYNLIVLSFIFILFISMELTIRNFNTFKTYILKSTTNEKKTRPSLIKYILIQINIYPNFILLFPFLILIDLIFGYSFSYYVLIVWFIVYMMIYFKTVYNYLKLFYKGI